MSSTPIVMCGKFAEHAANFSQLMLPEYEVIHHFQSTTEASSTLPAVMAGEKVASASGVGTNDGTVPKAIFVGGGFSEDELQQMRHIPEGQTIPWIAADPEKKRDVAQIGLDAAMKGITMRAKETLDRVLADGVGGGEVVRY